MLSQKNYQSMNGDPKRKAAGKKAAYTAWQNEKAYRLLCIQFKKQYGHEPHYVNDLETLRTMALVNGDVKLLKSKWLR